jgi:hypothetical protein
MVNTPMDSHESEKLSSAKQSATIKNATPAYPVMMPDEMRHSSCSARLEKSKFHPIQCMDPKIDPMAY